MNNRGLGRSKVVSHVMIEGSDAVVAAKVAVVCRMEMRTYHVVAKKEEAF